MIGEKIMWPKQSECNSFYGNPRGREGQASPSWESQNLVRVDTPFPIYFLGKQAKLRIHKKCSQAFLEWLERVWENSGKDKKTIHEWGMDNYAGAYNFRTMRGGKALSMHSYGCAVDFDAPRNSQYDRTPNFAKYRKEIVEPFIKLGGVWGGDWNGNGDSLDERSCDGMHFQFARLG